MVCDIGEPQNPVRKVRFFALAKAFMFWARDFNNAVHIEELTKQVQERTKVLRTVREAYMRDVIGCVLHEQLCVSKTW